MAPQNECQKPDRNPAYYFVFAAASKEEEQERAAQKDGTSKRRKTKERKVRVVLKTFQQHLMDVPGNRVKRKQSVFVPRFVAYFGNVEVTKIEHRMKPREIISAREQC